MAWEIDKERCLRCGACVSVCPALSLELSENGIVHDKETCTLCGICSKVCPVRAVTVDK